MAALRAARVAARGPQAAVAARAQGVLGRVRRVRVPVGLRREVEGEAVLGREDVLRGAAQRRRLGQVRQARALI